MSQNDLTSLNLGKDEAEVDEHLSDYFLQTPSFQKILKGEKMYVIGRKGTGKSAIYKYLEHIRGPRIIQAGEIRIVKLVARKHCSFRIKRVGLNHFHLNISVALRFAFKHGVYRKYSYHGIYVFINAQCPGKIH